MSKIKTYFGVEHVGHEELLLCLLAKPKNQQRSGAYNNKVTMMHVND